MMINKRNLIALRKAFQVLCVLVFLPGFLQTGTTTYAYQGPNSPEATGSGGRKIFLPLIRNGSDSKLPLMSGVYPDGWPEDATINNQMKPMDNWLSGVAGGRSTSIFGTFLGLYDTDAVAKQNVEVPLTITWNAGYAPFVNLPALPGDTAKIVATSTKYDLLIRTWAKSFKVYANNGTRFAYIAPLQEMNGYWEPYGGDPVNFILAYKRFQTIFAEVGVPQQSVKWVFAPNGWSSDDMPMFEAYYPGDAYVDVVGFSAYNWGYCKGKSMEKPEDVFNNSTYGESGYYLDRLRAMAPSKPIFITQTAASFSPDPAEKERWLNEAYQYLSKQPNVKAVIYFNFPSECDWPIFKKGVGNPGYKTAVNNNGYKYVSPAALMNIDHAIQ